MDVWGRIVSSWINCLNLEEIKDNDIGYNSLDVVSEYILQKENKQLSTEFKLEEGERWILHFLCEKFPALRINSLPKPNSEDFIVAGISLILYSSLTLRDEYIMTRMCSIDENLQVPLKSCLTYFNNSNLSLITKPHILEILSTISCDCQKFDVASFSSPLAYSAFLHFSTPNSQSSSKSLSRDLQEKHAEVAKLIHTISQCESEKDELNRDLEALKQDLSIKERELNQKNVIIKMLRANMEELKNSSDNNFEDSDIIYLKERHAEQVGKLTDLLENEQCKVLSLEASLEETREKFRNEQQLNHTKILELKSQSEHLELVNAEYRIKLDGQDETIKKLIMRNEELDALMNQVKEMSNNSFRSEDLSFNASSNNIGNFFLLEAENRIKELEEICVQKEAHISDLSEKLIQLEAALSGSELCVQELTHKINCILVALDLCQNKLRSADLCLENYSSIISLLHSKLEKLSAEKLQMEQSINEFQERIGLFQSQEEVSLRNALEKDMLIKKMKEDSFLQNEQFSRLVEELRAEVKCLQDDLVATNDQISKTSLLVSDNKELKDRLSFLETSLALKDQVIEEKELLKNAVAIELNDKITELQSNIKVLEISFNEAKSVSASLNDEIVTLNSQVESQRQEISAKDKIIEEKEFLKNAVAKELNHKMFTLLEKINFLEADIAQIPKMQDKITHLEAELKLKQELLTAESEKLKPLQEKCERMHMREKDVIRQCTKVYNAKFTEELQSRESASRNIIEDLKQKVYKLESDDKKWSQKVQKLTLELSQVKQLYENLKRNDGQSKFREPQLHSRTITKENGGYLEKGSPRSTPRSIKGSKNLTPRKAPTDTRKKTPLPLTPVKTNVADSEEFSDRHKQAMLVQQKMDWDNTNRLSELRARSSMLPPHLQSCYPGETQMSSSRFSEADFKIWSRNETTQTPCLRKRSNNDLFRTSDAFFIPLESRRRSISHESFYSPKTTKNS